MPNFIDKHFGRMGNRMFQMAYIYAQFRDGNIPDIYLQDYKYFDKYKNELRELFKQEGEPLDFVSVHVRKGKNPSVPSEPSYDENPFYVNLLDTDYYRRAAEEFPGANFLIFSDDPELSLETKVLGVPVEHKSWAHGSELEDFSEMARCKGHIIANSSFSWWAAYVGGGRTVAPKEWFSNNTKINYPNDWIVV